MKAKKILFPEEMIEQVELIISDTGQSFSDYVRNTLVERDGRPVPLPYDEINSHTEAIGELSNEINRYVLCLAEKDLYGDCLPDLIALQEQIQLLIESETALAKHIMHLEKE